MAQNIFSAPHPQRVPFPHAIMRYVTMTPTSSKGYQKLLETCKYFYFKNPVVFVEWLNFNTRDNCWNTYSKNNYLKIDFNIIPYKIWLTRLLRVCDIIPDKKAISKVLKKTSCCNLIRIYLTQQEISYDEYKLLTAGGKVSHLELKDVVIYYDDNALIPLENILKELPNIKWLTWYDTFCILQCAIPLRARKNLVKLPPFKKLVHLIFNGLDNTFDPNDFCELLEKNDGIFTIDFLPSISDEFRNQFETNVMKAAKNPDKIIICQRACMFGKAQQWVVTNKTHVFKPYYIS